MAMLRSFSDAATDGTGGNGFDGFTESAMVTSGLTTAASTAITWGELASLFGSLPSRAQRNATFQFNSSVERYLFQQVDGDAKPVILRSLTGGPGGIVRANGLDVPYALNPKLPDIAAGSKSVYVGDMSKFRLFSAPNNNGTSAPEILIYRDSALASKNAVGIQGRARRAGKFLSVGAGDDCRFITQKA